LIISIILIFCLNIFQLACYKICDSEKTDECKVKALLYMARVTIFVIYILVIIAYAVALCRIRSLFMMAYPEIYKNLSLRCKLYSFFLANELLLGARAYCYSRILFKFEREDAPSMINAFYISEILIIAILSYISLRAVQDNSEFENAGIPLDTEVSIRSSILMKHGANGPMHLAQLNKNNWR